MAEEVRGGVEIYLLALLAVGSTVALIAVDSTPLATDLAFVLISMPSIALTWIVIGTRSVVLLDRFSYDWSRKLRFAAGALLLAAILLSVNFFPFVRGCHYLGGAIRFAVNRSYYDHEVSLLPTNDKPRIAIFNWGGMIWSSSGLVYDESDEIALPEGQQSAAWRDMASKGELGCGNWDARRLWGRTTT